ncbi:hypothetical protein JRQ81_004861 [Phrynocephalus forsythii]|uniref:Ig-like domain-containing protein n=1 Tax=Phrynocephalus forsythii TaxID=171643 RepID=A0A9Q0XJ15_9SAUR|nr:hypothetical protein JRQ81_004861 [Phrynocephalus forsythii]
MAASFVQLYGISWVTTGLLFGVTGSVPPLERTHIRFIAARRGSTIHLNCTSYREAKWYKKSENGKDQELTNTSRIHLTVNGSVMMMSIQKIEHIDNGIYSCKVNNLDSNGTRQSWCCGTELKVMGASTFKHVQDRHMLKDIIILIQSILLVVFLSMPLLLMRGKGDSKDSSHEDHTYEGLAVEMADTYEDIGIYQDKAEKWNLGEQPSEE